MNIYTVTYFILCSMFSAYSFFVYTSGTELPGNYAKVSTTVIRGKEIWQKHNCISCHQLYGLGGYIGPDLTNVISQKGKGPDYARALIKNGTQRMPGFRLADNEVQCLIDFLTYVNTTASTYHIISESNM